MRKWTLIPAAVAMGIGLLGAGCGPKGEPDVTGAGLSKEDALARLRVVNDLRMLALTLEGFADTNDAYPTADGTPVQKNAVLARARDVESTILPAGFSWRATVLHAFGDDSPGTGRDVFFSLCRNKYPLAPGAGPADNWNRPELKSKPFQAFIREKPEHASETTWDTRYRVFIGNGAAFEPKKQLTRKDFTDGPDKTILIVEAGEAVPWPKPDELMYDPGQPLPKLGGMFPNGFYAAFADGTVRFIKNGTDEKLIRAMITRAGGEPILELPPKVNTEALRKAAGYTD
ncbi:MAG: hypothetical protein J0I06_13770 [Planctomycetes bacterium]|nr:hypothetical protein [Planctomycetota bacterium]